MMSRDSTSLFQAKPSNSRTRRWTYFACAAAALVSTAAFVGAIDVTGTTGRGTLATTGLLATTAIRATVPPSLDEVVVCGRKAFDIKAIIPNKHTASNSMVDTTFGLMFQGNEAVLENQKKTWFDTGKPVSNQF